MIKWTRTGRTVSMEGTTITYTGEGTPYTIESRKRHIPHANGIGTWDHASFFVMKNGEEIKERWSLGDAMEYAEGDMNG